MPFQKGVVTNPNGRKPISEGGSRNKKTSVAFDRYLDIFGSNLNRLETEIAKLEGKELADTLSKMADFIFPKRKSVESTNLNFDGNDEEKVKEYFSIGGKLFEL